MFDTFRRSWELTKASLRVLRSDKELLLFPLVSFLALVVVTLSFIVPWAMFGGFDEIERGEPGIVSIVLGFLFYLVTYTVVFFFQTALVGAAMIRLDGGDPTVRDGFRIAMSRLPQIIGYALIAATVGMILRWINERAGIVGQIVAGVIGFAWNLATFLVVPVLVIERVGPIDALKRSAALLKQTWGEQIVGNIGIGLVFGVSAFLVLIVGIGLMFVFANASMALAAVVLIAALLIAGVIGLIGSAASGIFTASLYRFATQGDPGAAFRTETMAAAFRQKAPSGVATFGGPR